MRSCLLLVVPVAFASACFEIDARTDAGIGDEPEGAITGRITVGDATGSVAGVDLAREMLTRDGPALSAITPTGDARGPARDAPRPNRPKMKWTAGDVIVAFAHGAYDKTSIAPVVRDMLIAAGEPEVRFDIARCTAKMWCKVNVYDGDGRALDVDRTRDVADKLAKYKAGMVQHVSVNAHMKGYVQPNDDYFVFQWHYQLIHLEPAWDLERGSDDVVIAVVDSGGVLGHPDLSSRWARDAQNQIVGMDFVTADFDNDGVPGADTNPEDPGDNLYGNQSSWHGTHIAGTIGAATDNTVGVAGVTWAGRIVPVRVLGAGLGGDLDAILTGVLWALGEAIDGVPNNVAPARVVNMSFGAALDAESTGVWQDVFASIFADPAYNDPIFIAAVGNDDQDADAIVPANIPGVISVGAARSIDGLRAQYSNFGSVVDVMAPGGDSSIDLNQDGQGDSILSTYDNDYDFEQGTSMAAPHVTGVVALLIAQNPELSHAQVEAIVRDSADPAFQCTAGCGAGLLDAFAALLLAGGDIEPLPQLAVDSSSLFFGDGVASRTFYVVNTGNAPFDFSAAVTGAQADLFDITPESATVAAASDGGFVPVVVNLARGNFESGSANVEITTVGLDPEQTVRVDIQFNDDPNRIPRTLETIEVAAYVTDDNGNLESVATTTTTRADNFVYEIKGLVEGTYFVFAVGDDNRDGNFDANIESLGGYPATRAPEAIEVAEDTRVEAIDFAVIPSFISGVLGGVGEPCDSDNDCTFAPDAQCILSFSGGYCSRLCAEDGTCDNGASCEILDCDTGPCPVCLVSCLSDSRCRFDEGYICDEYGTCTPEAL